MAMSQPHASVLNAQVWFKPRVIICWVEVLNLGNMVIIITSMQLMLRYARTFPQNGGCKSWVSRLVTFLLKSFPTSTLIWQCMEDMPSSTMLAGVKHPPKWGMATSPVTGITRCGYIEDARVRTRQDGDSIEAPSDTYVTNPECYETFTCMEDSVAAADALEI